MKLFFALFFGTFILEDVSLATSVALMAKGEISLLKAFTACFLGIGIGDCGLYFLGFYIEKFERLKHFNFFKKYRKVLDNAKNSPLLTYSILVSRAIPGTRIPTYMSAGFLRYPFLKFLWLTFISVFVWVACMLLAGEKFSKAFTHHWVLMLLGFLFFIAIIKSLALKIADPWKRKALLHAWRKWVHFEFWPGTIFYLPIIPFYIYLAIKKRSFLLPFYANPLILNAGIIGESKNDFLKHLDPQDFSTIKTTFLPSHLDSNEIKEIINRENFQYPFILKPDIGQRGYGVRIIESPAQLDSYLRLSSGVSLVAQTFSTLSNEAGIFYYRKPSEKNGRIFSITDKSFPFLIADGESKFGDLILRDKRARIIAPTYFLRHQENLDTIYPKGTKLPLSQCGNHCQGAIFTNGKSLITAELEQKIDTIAKTIPDFYFGRFDVKYRNKELLKKGLDFLIVEVNGAGSEATHIWDSNTKLLEAYGVLFKQWTILFAIGDEIKREKRIVNNVKPWLFLKESWHVFFRNDDLSSSS